MKYENGTLGEWYWDEKPEVPGKKKLVSVPYSPLLISHKVAWHETRGIWLLWDKTSSKYLNQMTGSRNMASDSMPQYHHAIIYPLMCNKEVYMKHRRNSYVTKRPTTWSNIFLGEILSQLVKKSPAFIELSKIYNCSDVMFFGGLYKGCGLRQCDVMWFVTVVHRYYLWIP
jgi:hypothetical protein